jgi:hypothetical protein
MNVQPRGLTTAFRWVDPQQLTGAVRVQPANATPTTGRSSRPQDTARTISAFAPRLSANLPFSASAWRDDSNRARWLCSRALSSPCARYSTP